MNCAVGHAFAHSVGRRIVIPRSPELLGALGVALLAMRRSGMRPSPLAPGSANSRACELAGPLPVLSRPAPEDERACAPTRDLLALGVPEMKLVGRFTCGACKLACGIDRFEVAGRRFPFGGRCSLYENVWKRRSRTAPAPDLVEERTRLLFGSLPKPIAPASQLPRSTSHTPNQTPPLRTQSSRFNLQRFLPSSTAPALPPPQIFHSVEPRLGWRTQL